MLKPQNSVVLYYKVSMWVVMDNIYLIIAI